MKTIEVLDNVSLAFWDYPQDDHPLIQNVRVAIEDAGLSSSAAVTISSGEAFRRAAKAMNDRTTEAKVFESEGSLYCEINRIAVDSDEIRLKRTLSGVWQNHLLGPVMVAGDALTLDEELKTCWQHKHETYEWSDIGVFLNATFKNSGLGVHAVKKNGSIYVIPQNDDCRTLIDKVTTFCKAIGVTFVPLPTPDSESHKEVVRKAVANTIQQEIDDHKAAMAKYSDSTRSETFAGRRSLIKQTAQYLVRLSYHLNGHAAGLAAQLDELDTKLKQMEASASAACQPQGRRVLMNKA